MTTRNRYQTGFCVVAAMLLGSLTAIPVHADAANGVGTVEKVRKTAYGTPPAAERSRKYAGDGVAFKELLETAKQSGAWLRFIDGSRLTVGADTSLRVDEFVFDPGTGQGSTGNALISISSGALRYVTGAMPKGHTVIDTPTATMTLRGTEVRVGVDSDGTTHLIVDGGNVDVHAKDGDQNQNFQAGEDIFVGPQGFQHNGSDGTGDPEIDDDAQNNGADGGTNSYNRVEHSGGGGNSNGSPSHDTESSHSVGGY